MRITSFICYLAIFLAAGFLGMALLAYLDIGGRTLYGLLPLIIIVSSITVAFEQSKKYSRAKIYEPTERQPKKKQRIATVKLSRPIKKNDSCSDLPTAFDD